MEARYLEIMSFMVSKKVKLSSFIQYILENPMYESEIIDLRAQSSNLITGFARASPSKATDNQWAYELVSKSLQNEIRSLLNKGEEWQFSALRLTSNQIQDFRIDRMADKLKKTAPRMWDLLNHLLSATTAIVKESPSTKPEEDDEYWGEMDLEGIINFITSDSGGNAREKRIRTRREAIVKIKKVVILSILMQSSNQKTNALETVIGIFLHACKTPEKVIEALAHLGVSISTNAIHSAITSLSKESSNRLRELGQTLTLAYAYDNFDVDLKSAVPTAQKSTTSLKHLTSALVFPLQHGVTPKDMECSAELWKKSPMNPDAQLSDLPPRPHWKKLIRCLNDAFPETEPHGLTYSQKFNAYKFLYDLCNHGPPYFAQFKGKIKPPVVIEQIPIVKTPITPARAMEFPNSTVSGNINTIEDLMNQAGVGEPPPSFPILRAEDDMVVDDTEEFAFEIKDGTLHMIMFHGDLGTGDRIIGIQLRRSLEKRPWSRFQYAIFVPGFFHVKMACVETFHRLFIFPVKAREDDTSVMRDIAVIRPKQTAIIASKPGFRRMHQIVSHLGICRRLDCWRVEAGRRNQSITSLQSFADSQPTFEELESLAEYLAIQYVSGESFQDLRALNKNERDQQYENALLFNKYALLYEEISFAMNQGDIGRLELCLIPWIFIFRATGKHKYAKHMTHFLHNVYVVYPPRLKRAVRYHTLVNPTGKPGKFRAVDWCVELNNLYTKAEHGGGSSNHTVDRIIKESPLVEVYRSIRLSIEQNFALKHLTAAHSDPDMSKTFDKLLEHIHKTAPHVPQAGRTSAHVIPDAIDEGRMKLMQSAMKDDDDDGDDARADIEDVVGELVDE